MTIQEIAQQARDANKELWRIRDGQMQRIIDLLSAAPDKQVGTFTDEYDPDLSNEADIVEISDDDAGLFCAYLFGARLTEKGDVELSVFGVKHEEHDIESLIQLDPASIGTVAVFVADQLFPRTQPA